jgi:hypothetical protein
MGRLILKRASIGSNQEDYDVVADDKVVGRIFLAAHSPRGTAWRWTLARPSAIRDYAGSLPKSKATARPALTGGFVRCHRHR